MGGFHPRLHMNLFSKLRVTKRTPHLLNMFLDFKSSSEDQALSESTSAEQPIQAEKPKRQRKPKEHKEPKPAYEPVKVGEHNGHDLYIGPAKGIYYVKTTKNGNLRKVYRVVKATTEDVTQDGEQPKVRKQRKRKAQAPVEGDTDESEKKAKTGELIEAPSAEKACALAHLLI